jgi:hypothetical protein
MGSSIRVRGMNTSIGSSTSLLECGRVLGLRIRLLLLVLRILVSNRLPISLWISLLLVKRIIKLLVLLSSLLVLKLITIEFLLLQISR